MYCKRSVKNMCSRLSWTTAASSRSRLKGPRWSSYCLLGLILKEIYNYCVELTANNLDYIMRTQDVYFKDRVKEKIIYEVISKTIHFYRNDPNKDNRSLIELLLEVREGCG